MSIAGPRNRWTAEADERLKKYLSQGMSHSQIATAMGVTRNMVCGRIWRLKRNGRI